MIDPSPLRIRIRIHKLNIPLVMHPAEMAVLKRDNITDLATSVQHTMRTCWPLSLS